MAIITLDFETPYGKGVRSDHVLHKYSLRSMSYEEYLFDPRFKVFGCAIKIDDGETHYYSQEHPGEKPLATVLADLLPPGNDHTLVAHNMLFDGAILEWVYGLSAARYWCTQRMSQAIWPQRSASLEQLCISCYPDNPNIRKGDELEDFANYYDLSPEQDAKMADYCINDVEVTFACLAQLWRVMPDDELELLDLTLKSFVQPLFEVDDQRLTEFLDTYNAETDAIVAESGVPRSTLASPKKFVQWVKDNLDLDIPIIDAPTKKNPDNRKAALGKDEPAFLDFTREHSEHQAIWNARWRVASNIARTRAERMMRHTQPAGYRYADKLAMPLNYYAAHTGRWGGTNSLNPQNFQRGSEHRKSLIAPEGEQVIVRDQSQIELRMNAWFGQEHKLLDIFARDGDVYSEFATQVFKYPVNKEDTPDERFVGKTCQLGLGYQTGPPKLQRTIWVGSDCKIALPLDQCKHIVYEEYRGTYTGIVNTWAECEYVIHQMYHLKSGEQMPWRCLVVEKERIRLPNGMYLNYPKLRVEMDEMDRPQYSYWTGEYRTNLYGGKLTENIIQALARIVIAQNMLDTQRWMEAEGIPGRIALTVHDEIIAIVRTALAELVYDKMGEFMARPPSWCNDGTLTLKSEGGIAHNYSK